MGVVQKALATLLANPAETVALDVLWARLEKRTPAQLGIGVPRSPSEVLQRLAGVQPNWAWNQDVRGSAATYAPTTLAELQAAVQAAVGQGRRIRPRGFRGAWSPLATGEVVIDTHALDRVTVDTVARTVRAEAGASLGQIDLAVRASGAPLMMRTSTVIPYPQVGGAIATGAHGSGVDVGLVADELVALEIVGPDGQVTTYRPGTHPDVWPALRCNLGTCGVVHAATFQLVDAHNLRVEDHPRTWRNDDFFADPSILAGLVQVYDHVEVFWWPTTPWVWVKLAARTSDPPAGTVQLGLTSAGMGALGGRMDLLGLALAARPAWTPDAMELLARLVPPQTYVVPAPLAFHYQVGYPRVWDLCYAIPAPQHDVTGIVAAWNTVVSKVQAAAAQGRYPLNQVLHLRYLKGSDAWLAPNHGVGLHHGMIEILSFKPGPPGWQAFFEEVEADWAQRGLPHWAKCFAWGPSGPGTPSWSTSRVADFRARLDADGRLAPFQAARAQLDPDRLFGNALVEALVG